ncbi:MAG: hypothetical protein ABSG52_03275 [Terriglobales bacterium]
MRQVFLLYFLLLIAIGSGISQSGDSAGTPGGGNDSGSTDPQFRQRRNEVDPLEKQMERDRAKKRNQDRQAAIKRDTDKLLALATELKDYVDKSNEHVLSLDVVRKAEEIEKLAHQVKEKMKD